MIKYNMEYNTHNQYIHNIIQETALLSKEQENILERY